MVVRRVLAAAAAATLLAGCTTGSHWGAPPMGARPSARPDTATTSATPGATGVNGRSPRTHLTLLPPGCEPGQIRLGRPAHDGGGGEDYTIFPLRLARGRPCTLWGTPRVRLRTATGARAPLRIRHRWFGGQRVLPVEVARHTPQWFALAVFRCDLTRTRFSRRMTAVLPNDSGAVAGAARIGYCGRRDGARVVQVGAIGSWVMGPHSPPQHVAVSMHSTFAPQGRPMWGRTDLDGDGHRDLVVVRPSGRVTARLGSATLRARFPRTTTARLQGLTDLTGDGRPDVLVGWTALGCGSGYRFCASGARVFTIAGGRLRVVRFPDDRPQWDDGEGDLFEGWICRSGGPTQVDLEQTGLTSYTLTRIRYRITGLHARPVHRTITHGSGSLKTLQRLTRTRCAGLDHGGWAPEQPPLQ